jgi:glutamate-ammonia-ligase adenylyltransferase
MQSAPTLRESLHPRPPLADPEAARARLAEIAPALPPGFLTPPCRDLLLGLAAHSPFLWRACLRAPERLVALLDQPPDAASRDIIARQRAVGAACGANPDLAEVGKRLRANREAHALLVALADLGGGWDVAAVTRALSDFADASVSAATEALLRQGLAAGRFRPPAPEMPQAGSGLIVLGLGKLGGGELNYSSDIDLVIFYETEAAASATGGDPKPFFVKLAQGLVKLLSDRTAEGYVHRIDYRLRPDPGSTAVALSTDFAFDYYQTLGQNWERAAFIKARPIAGDIRPGRRSSLSSRRSSGGGTSTSRRSPRSMPSSGRSTWSAATRPSRSPATTSRSAAAASGRSSSSSRRSSSSSAAASPTFGAAPPWRCSAASRRRAGSTGAPATS